MTKRTFQLDEKRVVLPKGTRVVLRTDLTGEDGYRHKTASLAVVRDVITTPTIWKRQVGDA